MLAKFGQLLRAVAGGPDPNSLPAPTEVIATINVGAGRPDWDYPRDTFRFGGYVYEAASGGASRSHAQLWNPTGSGVICVVEQINMYTTDNVMVITIDNATLSTSDGNERATDVRCGFSTGWAKRPACQIYSQATAQSGDVILRAYPIGSDGTRYWYRETMPWILMPGSGLNTLPGTDDRLNQTSFYWTERAYDREEVRGTPSQFAW